MKQMFLWTVVVATVCCVFGSTLEALAARPNSMAHLRR